MRANSDFMVLNVIFLLDFTNIWFIIVWFISASLNNQMIKLIVDIIGNTDITSTHSES